MSTLNPAAGATGGAVEHARWQHAAHHELSFFRKYIFSTDHKVIGIQFLITTMIMLMVGGSLAACRAVAAGLPLVGHADPGSSGLPRAGGSDFAGVLHDAVHDARDGDDFPRDYSDPRGRVRQLLHPADDRRRRHGLSAPERPVVLVHVAGDRTLHGQLLCRSAGDRPPAGLCIRCSPPSNGRPPAQGRRRPSGSWP